MYALGPLGVEYTLAGLAWLGPVWPGSAWFGSFWPSRINPYEWKGLEGSPKEYLLGIDRRLKEELRAKVGLYPLLKGKFYMGIVHASKIGHSWNP